ncbi:MAG: serine--tRNA ligase [Candidatus Aenigmatarchaeota archaeon]
MLDIKLIRENPDVVERNLEKRGVSEKIKLLHELISLDKERREIKRDVENLKHNKNILTNKIAELKESKKDIKREIREVEKITEMIKKLDEKLKKMNNRCDNILMLLPNMLDDSVPVGDENVEIRRFGSAPKFDFQPKNHLEIMQNLIDGERGAKVAGRGFFYIRGELALLDMALIRFAVDKLMRKGYSLIIPPYMMNRKAHEGATDITFFEEQLYKIDNEDLYMIATAEHPIAAMFMDEVLLASKLPIKFVGVSPCFRREVGAHGKYTKGLFRMHQFHKVEQFIFCLPNQSWELHEELQKNAEEIYQDLGLHYRVVNVCTSDIGDFAAKKYDIEVWMADGEFREIGSNSNCTDYQARRLNIRYREKDGQAPKGFVHTLNNTALATSRTMLAIIEQYQQKDGSVLIPKVLHPYMNGIKKIEIRCQ